MKTLAETMELILIIQKQCMRTISVDTSLVTPD